MAQWQWYRRNPLMAYGSGLVGGAPNMDWMSDDIRHVLLTNSYVPDLGAHDFFDDAVAAEASGAGYTAGGFAVTGKTLTYTEANAFATQWAASTAYGGDTTPHVVRPTSGNGFLYRAIGPGTSGATEPIWPTVVGATVVDGGVTWANIGRGITQFDMNDENRTGLTVSYRYSLLVNRTPASDATRPLLALLDWGSTQSITNGSVQLTINPQGLLLIAA
jgi:hypothetical protein